MPSVFFVPGLDAVWSAEGGVHPCRFLDDGIQIAPGYSFVVSVDDVVGVVEKDPVMSLRLIAVANSPVYRGVQQIESLKHAIPRIGLKETYNIIFAISVKSLYETKRVHFRNLMDELWQHALA